MQFSHSIDSTRPKHAASDVLAARGCESDDADEVIAVSLPQTPGHRPVVATMAVVVLANKGLAYSTLNWLYDIPLIKFPAYRSGWPGHAQRLQSHQHTAQEL